MRRGHPRGGWRGGPPMNFRQRSPGNSSYRNYRSQAPGLGGLQRYPSQFNPFSQWMNPHYNSNRNTNDDRSLRKDRHKYYHDKNSMPSKEHYHKNYNDYQDRTAINHNGNDKTEKKQLPSLFPNLSQDSNTQHTWIRSSSTNRIPPLLPSYGRGMNLQQQQADMVNSYHNELPTHNKPSESSEYQNIYTRRSRITDYFGRSAPLLSEESRTFTQSVDDTVNIVKEKLMNRCSSATKDPVSYSRKLGEDEISDKPTFQYNEITNQNSEAKIRQKIQRRPNINIKACENLKNKIVHELFQMDRSGIQKLMDNPNMSSKFEYAINSLITESQMSFKRHTRAAAEQSFYSSDKYSDNDTIYKETFIKHMQPVLNANTMDTLDLSKVTPVVMATLKKYLQLGDSDLDEVTNTDVNEMSEMSHAGKDFYNTNIEQNSDYKICADQMYSSDNTSNNARSYEFSSYQTSTFSFPSESHQKYNKTEENLNKDNSEETVSTKKSTRISVSDYQQQKELTASRRRTSANVSISEENHDYNLSLFNSVTETLSEDDDTFAELDNQYHVAVDPSLIEEDFSKSCASVEYNNIYEDIGTSDLATNIKEEVDLGYTNIQEITKSFTENKTERQKRDSSDKPSASTDKKHRNRSKESRERSHKRPHEERHSHRKDKRIKRHHSEYKETYREKYDSDKKSKYSRSISYSDKYVRRKSTTDKSRKSESTSRSSSRKHDKVSKKYDASSKKTDSSPIKSDVTSKKLDNPPSKIEIPIMKIDTTPTKLDALPTKHDVTPTKSSKLEKLPKSSEDVPKTPENSTTSNSLSENSNDGKEKPKYKTIDMFLEKPRKMQIHQAPRNTATIPEVKVENQDKKNNKVFIKPLNGNKEGKTKRSVGIQVMSNERMKSVHTQTQPINCKNKSAQASVETNVVAKNTTSNPSEISAEYAHIRIKEIDLEIQALLQEKFKLSLEVKDASCDLGISVLDVDNLSPKGNLIIENISEDAIIEGMASLSEEELEKIAFGGLETPDHIESIEDTRGEREKVHNEKVAAPLTPDVVLAITTSSEESNTRTPRRVIRSSKRKLEQVSLKKTVPIAKKKSPINTRSRRILKAKSMNSETKAKEDPPDYTNFIKPCSVILIRSELNDLMKNANVRHVQLEANEEVCVPKTAESDNDKQDVVKKIVPVSNEFQFQDCVMVISEDIEINDNSDPQLLPQSDEVVVDNSSVTSEETIEDTEKVETSKVYDFIDDEELRKDSITVSCNTDAVLAIEHVENKFLVACVNGNVYYIDSEGQLLFTLKGSNFGVTCLSIVKSNYEIIVYTGSLDSRIRCYDLKTGMERGQECNVLSPIQSMDLKWGTVFVGTRTGFVLQFECRNNMLIPVSTVKFSDQSILALKALKEGPRKVLLVASRSDNVTIKDAQTGLLLRTLAGPKMTVYSLLFEDGKVFCGTSGNNLHAFDFVTGTHVGDLTAGRGCVCLRVAGTLLFAGCYDGCIYVFKPGESTPFAQLKGPSSVMLLSMAVTPTKIIAGYNDQKLYIWKIPFNILQEMILS